MTGFDFSHPVDQVSTGNMQKQSRLVVTGFKFSHPVNVRKHTRNMQKQSRLVVTGFKFPLPTDVRKYTRNMQKQSESNTKLTVFFVCFKVF